MQILNYSKVEEVVTLPDFIEAQKVGFEMFLQAKVPPKERKPRGLQKVFLETFPVEDPHNRYTLEFVEYEIGEPKYTPEEALKLETNYEAPLRAKFNLVVKEGSKVKEVIEQKTHVCDIPLMTPDGHFIVNGVKRVVVMQLRRAPGIYLSEQVMEHGRKNYIAEIVPERGPWITINTDASEKIVINLDRRHKLPITTVLLGIYCKKREEIIRLFHKTEKKTIENCEGYFAVERVIDPRTNQVILEPGEEISKEKLEILKDIGKKRLEVVKPEIPFIINTLKHDKIMTQNEALRKIHKTIRGTEPQTLETAREFIKNTYFDTKRFDLGRLGRYKNNRRFGINIETTALVPEDLINAIRSLIKLARGEETADDPDHIANKQLRRTCEVLEDAFRDTFQKLQLSIKEKMLLISPRERPPMPSELITVRLIQGAINGFFNTNSLSQFMEEANPLAEITHKRRMTKLGPGGLTRATAGLEARDVHYSHYGRICPIETPEGPNIGVINSLASYARVDDLGFICTPYRKVVNGKVTNEIVYLRPDEEDKYAIAQANVPIDKNGKLKGPLVLVRKKGEFPLVPPEEVEFIDVSPAQMVSLSSSLIPFLEHDDANRALMGSNMQRQATPLLFTEAPLVATGMEAKIGRGLAKVLKARRSGIVFKVTADEIVIKPDSDEIELDRYSLIKFARTNQDTAVNQRPIVKVGDKVKAGDIIADGHATKDGWLALGRNVLVAFMPWRGYNFEDAIVVSERLLEEDVFTSVTIQEFDIDIRDTKLGPEQITREIPGVSENDTRNLDENGIIRIGAEVRPDDILVGKISPKGEKELAPEERLLRAIFGEKAYDVKDTSLRVPPGVYGVVIDVRVLSRKSDDNIYLKEIESRKKAVKDKYSRWRKELKAIAQMMMEGVKDEKQIREIKKKLRERLEEISAMEQEELEDIEKSGDPLEPGVLKRVKVYIAQRRNLAIGDKLCGRHGNKGVIAKIVPKEDMPYLPDGTPVDIVLNPLGVPSRMNVGQILETYLGWAAHKLGVHVVTPVFSGASVPEIKELMRKAGLPEDGKTVLYDGRTGEPFKNRVTVGYMYILKLIHMAEDKMHARSIGKYALITQQPLGGKARFGGQRFGEMEVWALEAYGAAYTLQEMLTVKSDDIQGRKKLYEAIIKGERLPEPGTPTSLDVLLSELRGLCLNPQLIKEEKQ